MSHSQHPESRARARQAELPSLSRDEMLDLMLYADGELGELDGARRAHVEELLRTSDEARRVVESMGALGEVVRDGALERAANVPGVDGIADRVMAAIETAAPSNVVPMSIAPRARRTRGGVTAAVIAAVALAAGAAMILRGPSAAPVAKEAPVDTTPALAPPPMTPALSTPTAVAQLAPQAVEVPGVDLEEARSTTNKVDVFFMSKGATAGAVTSVVVWIDDRHGAP
jgi:hypothetical protein